MKIYTLTITDENAEVYRTKAFHTFKDAQVAMRKEYELERDDYYYENMLISSEINDFFARVYYGDKKHFTAWTITAAKLEE